MAIHDSMWGHQPFTNFGITAFASVYQHGHRWYRELMQYLQSNRDYTIQFIQEHLAPIQAIIPQATYLAWLDCTELQKNDRELIDFFIHKAKVFLSPGISFGTHGSGYMRLNFACPRNILEEALNRITQAL